MDSSTSTLWTGPFLIDGVSGKILLKYFIEILVFNVNCKQCRPRPDATECSILIWVYTVCQCPFYGTLGLNGLKLILNTDASIVQVVICAKTKLHFYTL